MKNNFIGTSTIDSWTDALARLPSFSEYTNAIEQFSGINFSGMDSVRVEELYFQYLRIFPRRPFMLSENDLTQRPFYRVRDRVNEYEDVKLATTFSYPPKEFTPLNRANVKGVPVFYCSPNALTAIREVKSNVGDICYLGKWYSDANQPARYIPLLHGNVPEYSYMMSDYKLFMNDFEQFLCKIKKLKTGKDKHLEQLFLALSSLFVVKDDKEYVLTSWIADNVFCRRDIDILMYPSVIYGCRTMALAMRAEYVDEEMKLHKVFKYQVNDISALKCNLSLLGVGESDGLNVAWNYEPTRDDIDHFRASTE